ncbi:MAG: class I mannose-6-phosphate isomerase [Clostridia bacterium]|nr:class I mannose-6-phosphate isomerase [Clostridia bacterium]
MPIAPILMSPAYRCGDDTPWGGEGLRMMFGRDIPDEHTGESLEASALPGLESRDPEGRKLTDLIEQYGERLTGPGLSHPFPLLLKLLDAKDRLSVQVHPDNNYAEKKEHALGKTEAWHILFAAPGAELVYGVKAGVTKEQLRKASEKGAEVEGLLRRIKVKAGQTYYIPAGTLHAIGAGIILYEIQQSSMITYRFYDWNRKDAQGNRRELHISKAVDVVDVRSQSEPVREQPVGPGRFRILDETYFGLERFCAFDSTLPADPRRFAFFTAVRECRVSWDGGELTVPAGSTALLPADGYDLHVKAPAALLAYPTV